MKVNVDQEVCIGCGMCIDICPDVFKFNEDSKSEVIPEVLAEDLAEDVKTKMQEAKEVCPVDAIVVEQFLFLFMIKIYFLKNHALSAWFSVHKTSHAKFCVGRLLFFKLKL